MKKFLPFLFICLILGGYYYYLIYSLGGKRLIDILDQLSQAVISVIIAGTSFLLLKGYDTLNYIIPYKKHPGIRFTLTVILCLALVLLSSFLFSIYLPEIKNTGELIHKESVRLFQIKGIIVALILSLLFSLGDFSWYNYYKFEEETLSKLKGENRRRELQFNALKEQLTPHYLFNSLNSASNLITTNPAQAELFLRNMALNFQEMLENAGEALNTIEKELQTVESYFHLMKVRFGEKIKLYIDVDKAYLQHKIPYLSLQLLAENALKHNIASLDKPVEISIKGDKRGLKVENNLTRPPSNVKSTGTGLTNLLERYAYLGETKVKVFHSISYFEVTLPYVKHSKQIAYV